MKQKCAGVGTIAALALVSVLAGCGNGSRVSAGTRVENSIAGYTVALPAGWRMRVDLAISGSAATISTYSVARIGDDGVTPPKGETWLLLYDYGPLWTTYPQEFRPLPLRLPPEAGAEGFGTVRMVNFKADGHAFQAFIKGEPRPDATLGLLRSIKFTPFGRSLALVGKVHTTEGVQIWRMGNPRSTRRLIVVGCPRRAKGCSGIAVTGHVVRNFEPLAADLWVIESLHGREDILARLQRQLRPEATIRLGSISDPELWARRIVALAR